LNEKVRNDGTRKAVMESAGMRLKSAFDRLIDWQTDRLTVWQSDRLTDGQTGLVVSCCV
jgi:hypothetical protein